jgi:hypothetical protein
VSITVYKSARLHTWNNTFPETSPALLSGCGCVDAMEEKRIRGVRVDVRDINSFVQS